MVTVMQDSQQNDSAILSLSQCFPGRTEFEIELMIRCLSRRPDYRAQALSLLKGETITITFPDITEGSISFTKDEASLLCAHAMLRPGCVLE